MLTIINTANDRQTNYSRDYLKCEARLSVKHAPDSDGKLRAWSLVVIDSAVALRADYLTRDGNARTVHTAL
jgi:hypothetical protein